MIGGHGLVVFAPGRPWDFGVLRALQTGKPWEFRVSLGIQGLLSSQESSQLLGVLKQPLVNDCCNIKICCCLLFPSSLIPRFCTVKGGVSAEFTVSWGRSHWIRLTLWSPLMLNPVINCFSWPESRSLPAENCLLLINVGAHQKVNPKVEEWLLSYSLYPEASPGGRHCGLTVSRVGCWAAVAVGSPAVLWGISQRGAVPKIPGRRRSK